MDLRWLVWKMIRLSLVSFKIDCAVGDLWNMLSVVGIVSLNPEPLRSSIEFLLLISNFHAAVSANGQAWHFAPSLAGLEIWS